MVFAKVLLIYIVCLAFAEWEKKCNHVDGLANTRVQVSWSVSFPAAQEKFRLTSNRLETVSLWLSSSSIYSVTVLAEPVVVVSG